MSTKLWLFSIETDKSTKRFLEEAKSAGLDSEIVCYPSLVSSDGALLDKNNKPLVISKPDKVIVFNTNRDYSIPMYWLIENHFDKIALNRECYKSFRQYKDKAFQAETFRKANLNTPKTWHGSEIESLAKVLELPVIAKPRIGSRQRGIRVFDQAKRMREFFASTHKDVSTYIFQEYLEVAEEYRLIVLQDKLVGVVGKKIHLKEGGRIGVTVKEKVADLPAEVETAVLKAAKAFKVDFAGIDVVLTKDGNYSFIEINYSPQFSAFEEATGINVAKQVIDAIQ